MSDLSLADELEFESWPQEKKELAAKYLATRANFFIDRQWDAGYDAGYERGKIVGYRLGRAQSAETDKR